MLGGGFLKAASPEEADIIIINTCGFIEDAKKESLDVVFEALAGREEIPPCDRWTETAGKNFSRKIVVMGCLSQRYMYELKKEIPEVDLYYGLADPGFLPTLCHAFNINLPVRIGVCKAPLIDSVPYRYIKISEGCSNRCSYCAIPGIRGDHVPFSPEMILKDAREAVADGAKELILVAQDTAVYRYKNVALPALIRELSGIQGIEWLRLLYCHPDHVDESLIQEYRTNPLLCKYIDLPFQHASRKMLRAMGRKGDAESYLNLVAELRSRIPGIRIRSTFMVGFPGESPEDFRILCEFLEKARIDRAGCFVYSPEEGTAAAGLPGKVPSRIKKARFNKLMKLQRQISGDRMKQLVGTTLRVMVEEQVDEHIWAGRTEYDAPEVDGIFYLTGAGIKVNSIIRSVVTDSMEYDLFGEPA